MKVLLASLFLVCGFSLQAQLSYSIYGGGTLGLDAEGESFVETTGQEILALTDTTYIRALSPISYDEEQTFSSELGYRLGISMHIPVAERLSITTGFEAEFMKFNVQTVNTNAITGAVFFRDTLIGRIPELADCTNFTNSEADLPTPKAGNDFRNFYFTIPVQAEYELVANRLVVRAGVFVQALLVSNRYSEQIAIQYRENTDGFECTYVFIDDSVDSKRSFADAQFGGDLGLGIRLSDKFELDLGARKQFTNVFAGDFGFGDYRPNFKPFRFTAGIRYRL